MMRILILLVLLTSLPVSASETDDGTLTIGTRVIPPFVIKDDNGELSGVSIEFWQLLAESMDLQYRFEERDLKGLIEGLQDGSLDASIAALTVTADREQVVDFTHPFHTTGLAIAVPRESSVFWVLMNGLFSWQFLAALISLGSLLFMVGASLWLVERKKNAEQFGGTLAEGLGSSFWWAAVTMTTVGYGDKSPVTLPGRVIGLVWMFAAIILISTFTAAIATALTVSGLKSGIEGPQDLVNARVATLKDSTSATYLRSQGIGYQTIDNLDEGFKSLVDNRYDALVYDKPILLYVSNQQFPDSTNVIASFNRQDYAVALPENSPLREDMNRTLLATIEDPRWQQVLDEYFGRSMR